MAHINEWQRFTHDESAMPDENDADGLRAVKPLSNRARKRLERVYMLKALNNVHNIFADIADVMLDKLRDMSDAWKSTEEWCETLEQIRRGGLRYDVIEEREE